MQLSLLETPVSQRHTGPIAAKSPAGSLTGSPFFTGIECLLDFSTSIASFAIALSFSASMRVAVGSRQHMVAAALIFSCLVVLLLDRSGAYRSSGGLLRIRETASILEASLFTFVIVGASVLLFGDVASVPFVAGTVCFLAATLVAERQLLQFAIDALRQRGYGSRRVLICGSGSAPATLFSALSRSPKLGLYPVAIVDESGDGIPDYGKSYWKKRPQLVRAAFHASLVKAYKADVVIVATRPPSDHTLRHIMEESASAGAVVVFAADIAALDSTLIDYIELDGQLLYGMHTPGRRYLHLVCARTIDLLVSSVLFLLVCPLFALISLIIKLDSAGPVFFRQQRVGKDGGLFTIYKFRSMHENECGDGVSPETSSDPRITRVGKWLRRTSIDEIPQLLNIVKGEMALVGPRPEMPFIVAEYSDTQRQRLSVKPGLTGIWQISADRGRPIHENIQYDLYYIQNRSVCMDIAVLFHTLLFAMNGV